MSKKSIVNAVAGKLSCSKADALKSVDAVAAAIHEVVGNGAVVRLAPLGLFKKAHRKARTAKNLHTGETIQIAAKDVIVFKASKG